MEKMLKNEIPTSETLVLSLEKTPDTLPVALEELEERFLLLFKYFDYQEIYHIIHAGKLNIFLRRKARTEAIGLFICLWRLALERGFKEQGIEFFNTAMLHFVERKDITTKMRDAYTRYWNCIAEKREEDFSLPAQNFITYLSLEEDITVHTLTIALYLRRTYLMLLEHFI
ncbi:MAG: hypothetical protein ACRCV3_01710 [Desulfovibrionaceae bacterium]